MVHFRLDPSVTFINHGSFGATPVEILERQAAWRERLERQPVDFLVRQLPGLLQAAREPVAALLGAAPEDVVFVRNATEGVGAVLASLDLPTGATLWTTHRYNAVFQAMQRRAAGCGGRVEQIPLPWPVTDPAALLEAVATHLPAGADLLVIDHITSPTGLVLPIEEIVALARSRGVPVLVDGAHSAGQLAVDLGALGADWWVGNLHKWLCAPKGAAVLWTRRDRQGDTHGLVTSHGYREGYALEFDWPGTFDPSAWLCADAAVALHERLGGAAFRAANHALVRTGRALLSDTTGLPSPHPDDPRLYGSMAALPLGLPEADAEALNRHLWTTHRIEVPVSPFQGDSVLRISGFSAYNTPDDYAHLARVLPDALQRFRSAR